MLEHKKENQKYSVIERNKIMELLFGLVVIIFSFIALLIGLMFALVGMLSPIWVPILIVLLVRRKKKKKAAESATTSETTESNATESTDASESAKNNPTTADELLKYKELLDAGVITQEEFDAKKKELLKL